jgi:uncharacterized protein
MQRKPLIVGLTATVVYLSLSILAACVTINVYFPEAAVKDLSEQIEEEILQQAAEEGGGMATEEAPPTSAAARLSVGPTLHAASAWVAHLLVIPAYAETTTQDVAEPEITNPAIRRIIDSRAARLPEINKYKTSGVLGENNQALVEIRNLDAISDLRERAAAQRVVKAENADREQLFREIAAAKNVDLAQLPQIRSTYAETLREKARKGDWIQLPDGSWKQK